MMELRARWKSTGMLVAVAALLACVGTLLLSSLLQQRSEARRLHKQLLEDREKAEKGDAEAQYSLGLYYFDGPPTNKLNLPEAVKWFRKAADQDNTAAQHCLGIAYAEGAGVVSDYAEAYAWWSLADKTMRYATENRDALEKKMTPQQITAGKKRAEELREQIAAKLKSGGK